MSATTIIPLAGIYLLGCMLSGLANSEKIEDGHRLLGRILLWPLFFAKSLVLIVVAAAKDLAGKSA